jgi:hypothetical protein
MEPEMKSGNYINLLLKTLAFFSPPSGFGLCNRISGVVRRRAEKARIRTFSFTLGAFAFFAVIFLRAPPFFFSWAHRAQSAKNVRAPISDSWAGHAGGQIYATLLYATVERTTNMKQDIQKDYTG